MNKFYRITRFAIIGSVFMFSAVYAEDICREPVSTAQGLVVGASVDGLPVCAYKGVPYAAPPVGNMRWRAPQPPPQRKDVLTATAFSPKCAQAKSFLDRFEDKKTIRSEDCLYLNVWRPKKSGKYPVMVWIHGGGLVMGKGSSDLYWGDRMAAQKDVVVVTINYRLSVFGFLALPALSAEDANGSSGNYGLQDQIEALKWVRENIAAFGGDPANVTIFGESAGGWSVCNILASPLAEGLFHRAVMESGGCDATKTVQEGYADGETFLKRFKCSKDDVLSCLRFKSAQEILKGEGGIPENVLTGPVKFVWLPKEDGRVLKETPIEALRNGRYNKTPLIVSSNRDEIKLLVMTMPGIRHAPKCVYKLYVRKVYGDETLKSIERLYPYKNYGRSTDAILDALGDMNLGCKCFDAAEAARVFDQPVYYCRFDYDDHKYPHYLGAGHSVEIPFVFGSLDRSLGKFILSKKDAIKARPLSDAMMSYWTNFAKAGNPNAHGLLEWPVYKLPTRGRMIFDLPMRVENANNVEKCEYWRTQNIKLK